ncbi:mucin-21-like isoform X2 [Acipenser ruthenus]|uniref:mucin-21-like isoform X2 n=1 Tax=Acipenser ruthenus TaxID=7906 RepID=UPI0027422F04|nr:mucin-21-like isoform X2 [Acipenser ruthenus]
MEGSEALYLLVWKKMTDQNMHFFKAFFLVCIALSATTTGQSTVDTPTTGATAAATTTAGATTATTTAVGATAATTTAVGATAATTTAAGATAAATTTAGATAAATTAVGATAATTTAAGATAAATTAAGATAATTTAAGATAAATTAAGATDATNNSTGTAVTSATNPAGLMYCKTFACTGNNCYTNYTNQNATMCATNYSYCMLNRTDSSYNAGCSQTCAGTANMCSNASSTQCIMECCATSLCLRLNGTIQGIPSTAGTTSPPPNMTTTTVAVANNGKSCQSFTCNGDTCYKGKTDAKFCQTGMNYCELKKKVSGVTTTWTAGCSSTCQATASGCTSTATDCLQECCDASATVCLKLDGTVNIKGAADTLSTVPLMNLLTVAFLVFISSSLQLH